MGLLLAILTLVWVSQVHSISYKMGSPWQSIIGLMQFFIRLHIGRKDGQERVIPLTVIILQSLLSWNFKHGLNNRVTISRVVTSRAICVSGTHSLKQALFQCFCFGSSSLVVITHIPCAMLRLLVWPGSYGLHISCNRS